MNLVFVFELPVLTRRKGHSGFMSVCSVTWVEHNDYYFYGRSKWGHQCSKCHKTCHTKIMNLWQMVQDWDVNFISFNFIYYFTGYEKKAVTKRTRDWCLYWQTLGVREERKVKLGSILFTSLKIQTMLKLRNTLPLEYFFFSTSGLDRK